jgi:replication factor C small subunit
MSVEQWVEKHRPKKFNEYVWKDEKIKNKILEYVNEGSVPHILLAGTQGTGKSSLANVILHELHIPRADILWIPASRERKIEDIQNKIGNFVNTWAFGPSGIKYVILDELDSVSPAAQKMLRTDMEVYSSNVRFIGTCNYINKIIPAIRSRFQEFIFKAVDVTEFTVRLVEILDKEEVQYDFDLLENFVESAYPDLRKCINLLQQNTVNKKLQILGDSEKNQDYMLVMVDLFKKKKHLEARKLIVTQAQPEEYPDIYRFLYRNLELFGDTIEKQEDALLIIKDGLVNHTLVADIEINLSATLVLLSRLNR